MKTINRRAIWLAKRSSKSAPKGFRIMPKVNAVCSGVKESKNSIHAM